MLNLLSSRVSIHSSFRRNGLSSYHCPTRIADANLFITPSATVKDSSPLFQLELSEPSRTLSSDVDCAVDLNLIDDCLASSPCPSTDEKNSNEAKLVKGKKNKSKSSKRLESCASNSTSNVECEPELSAVASSSNSCAGLKTCQTSRKETSILQAMKSIVNEDDCGVCVVDELEEFKLEVHKSDKFRCENDVSESVSNTIDVLGMKAKSIEIDSGFGDSEIGDHIDTAVCEGSLSSPSSMLSSGNFESTVKCAAKNSLGELDDFSLSPVAKPSSNPHSSANSGQMGLCEFSFDDGIELVNEQLDDDFVVVQQKKRRPKLAANVPANCGSLDRTGISCKSSIKNSKSHSSSTENSTRSPSPSSIANSEQDLETRISAQPQLNRVRGRPCGFKTRPQWNGTSSKKYQPSSVPSTPSISHPRKCPSESDSSKPYPHGRAVADKKSAFSYCDQLSKVSLNRSVSEVVTYREASTSTSMELLDDVRISLPDVIPTVEWSANPDERIKVQLPGPDIFVSKDDARETRCELPVITVDSQSTQISDSSHCTSSADVSRPPSPSSICDTVSSKPDKSLQHFDLVATQIFLFKAYHDTIQLSKTHPHSVTVYKDESVLHAISASLQ